MCEEVFTAVQPQFKQTVVVILGWLCCEVLILTEHWCDNSEPPQLAAPIDLFFDMCMRMCHPYVPANPTTLQSSSDTHNLGQGWWVGLPFLGGYLWQPL